MSIKRGFWWGKLSGIVAGGIFGAFSYSLPLLLDVLLNGRLQSEPDLIFGVIFFSLLGAIVGVFAGAIIGAAKGVILAWAEMEDDAPTIWLVVWVIAALFTSLLILREATEPILMMPAIWAWLGGIAGWCGGLIYQSKAITN